MSSQSAAPIFPFRKPGLEAVCEIFKRAAEHDPDNPVIEDRKNELTDPLRKAGALQNCEFGMILLLAGDWLGDELSAAIAPADPERPIKALVQQTVSRLLSPQQSDQGGGGGLRAFFTGEPYSKRRNNKFAANLDAAMITVAFLMPAVAQYNAELAKLDLDASIATKLPDWAKNVRDAALFVISEGLRYALGCRVVKKDGKFEGFTCDPDSLKERPDDGCLKREDRLFYTWTACETINDLKQWRESFLEKSPPLSAPLPPQAVSEIKSLVGELEAAQNAASVWCEDEFFQEFANLEIKESKALVRDVEKLGGARLSEQQDTDVAELRTCVQHVYHISQYAAIRSLQPEGVKIPEVRVILDKLDNLVTRSIIGTGLDDAEQEVLFKTLTREYSLGKWDGSYNDDAWYPLVVRSLAGLLARTLTDIGERASGPELQALTELVASFTRSLDGHVKNLLSRRPSGGENGPDCKLWSFAADQPYVLYATQRTIFALMKYEEFLRKVSGWKPKPQEGQTKSVTEAVEIVARRLAEHFSPMIAELLPQLGVSVVGDIPVQLPREKWASEVVRKWLTGFTQDFDRYKIAAYLTQQAQNLIYIRLWVEHYQPSQEIMERKGKNAMDQHAILKGEYDSICRMGLSAEMDWTEATLVPVLFDYLFQQFVSRPDASLDSLKREDSTELWKLMQSAIGTLGNISKLDPRANPK
jgi:hypothetical protein